MPESPPPPPSGAGPSGLVEHFFRHEIGRLHGALVRLVGVHNLTLAEDVAQEAMLRAMRVWSIGGVPPNPSAWITQVAMNLARDALRHQRMSASKESAILTHQEQTWGAPAGAGEAAHEIRDDVLRLMFVCCHPAIAPDAQVILALKTLCGFSTGEIARAFLTSEAAIEKQLNDLGIFHFDQIAGLNDKAAHFVGEEVGLPGRVPGWIAKAKELTAE